jgi:arylsulfatase A-like enzyme
MLEVTGKFIVKEPYRNILNAAAWGGVVWLVYGVTETILSTGIQLWRFPDMEVLGWQWRLVAMLLGAYAAIGVGAGLVGGILLTLLKRWQFESSHQALAALTFSGTFAVNLAAAWPLSISEEFMLAIAALWAAGFAAALVSGEWAKRIAFLSGPWTVSLLLLGVPCLRRELLNPEDSTFKKTSLSLVVLCAVLAVAWFFRRNRVATLPIQFVRAAAVFAVYVVVVVIAQRDGPVLVGTPASGASRPNVVLIVMDTVRADHLSLYGYSRDTTPNLRQFAREATVYTRAIAASDFTLATHAAMFTGVYPDWNGAIQSNSPDPIAQPMNSQQPTMAEMLRSMGYWTVETAANFAFLGPWTGLTRGFEVADLRRPVVLASPDRPFYLRRIARRLLGHVASTLAFYRPTRTAENINARARVLLDEAEDKGTPLFLFLNYMDAHVPISPSRAFNRFRTAGDTPLEPAGMHDLKMQVIGGKRNLAPGEVSYLTGLYDGGIAEEDAAIGELLNRLRALGLYENTLIVVTADHGDAFGEHNLLDHFVGFVYQDLVHVPLIVKYPGQHEAKQSDELVSQVDLMPTVLDVAGANSASPLQGRSLLRTLEDPDRAVFSRGVKSSLIGAGNRRFDGLRRAIFSGSLKLIGWTAGPPELYDLATDPDERHNLYTPGDPRAADLFKRLENWVAGMPRAHARPPKLDKSAEERLKSLGYVQ